MPAADEVYRLQSGNDPECQLFQYVARQGHYAAKGGSQQGIYCIAPSGVLLASINSTEAGPVARTLQRGLEEWNKLPKARRLLPQDPSGWTGYLVRDERFYPIGGLVLRQYVRDLPHATLPNDWRGKAWNQDIAWFRREEAVQFIPSKFEVGATSLLPNPLIRRLARAHLVDTVRGQSRAFSDSEIKMAYLKSTVTGVKGQTIEVRFDGETRADSGSHGMALKLIGGAVYDLNAQKFTRFELVAAGNRWGGTQYNYRGNDPPSPIGFAFTLASTSQPDLLAPELFGAYGWR